MLDRTTLTYEVEYMTPELEAEFTAMIMRYYYVTEAATGLPGPYDFDWKMYRIMQQRDALYFFTCRDENGTLLGAAIYMIVPHPHHRTHVQAVCDSLSVDHTKRRMGIGRGLMQCAEPVLKALGVQTIVHSHRVVYNSGEMFTQQGYKPAEMIYVKDI